MGKKSRKKRQKRPPTRAQSTKEAAPAPQAPPGEPRARISEVILACLLAYAVCFILRGLELPVWQGSQFQIQGEYLMATHDAYAWLAGAKEINRNTGSGMSQLLSFLHQTTGFKLANIAFWLPVIFGPLAALPLVLLGWREGQPEAGLTAGIMTGGCLAFLLRTRFGFADTDILTLFFPVATAAGLLAWLTFLCRRGWKSRADAEVEGQRYYAFLVGAIPLGLIIQGYDWFYGKIHIALAACGIAFLLGLFLAPRNRLSLFLLGYFILVAAGFGGALGLLLGLAGLVVALWRPSLMEQWLPLAGFAVLALLVSGTELSGLISSGLHKLFSYAKLTSSETAATTGLELPAVLQSVREAQNVDWGTMISRSSGGWWLFWPALLGFAYLVYRRPMYLVWLPLLGLAVASVKLGNRFAMFGGAPLGLGLAFGLNRLLLDCGQPRWRRWAVQIALCCLVAWPMATTASKLRPAPILPKAYARTFLDLKKEAPPKSQLWQWWDYGYAGQYYAERRTFGDGGKHDGKYLYPLARVHATHSPLQANQLIKLTAATQMEQYREMLHNGSYSDSHAKRPFYPGDPVQKLREMGPEQAQSFVESLKDEELAWPDELPPQYLVLSWENLRLAYWISTFGNWNLETGKNSGGKIQRIKGEISINTSEGILELSDRKIPLEAVALLTKKGTRHYTWSRASDVFALINRAAGEFYLMNGRIYNSLMIQMLIGDPKRFEDHFQLVVDNFPWNRAYRVK